MVTSVKRIRTRSGGLATVLALVFLAIFATLAVVFFSATSMNLAAAGNSQGMLDARLAAESGQSFLIYKMERCGVKGSLRGQALLDGLALKLKADLNGTANLNGAQVTSTSTAITVPQISLDGGKSFTAVITLPAADTLRLTVTGQVVSGGGSSATAVQRQVVIDLHPQWDQALGFGLCSKGPVQMGMNTDFSGINNASDGSIYSAAPGVAVTCGSGTISGDVSVSTPGATTSLGNTTVGGSINYNAPPITMPVIDRTPYTSLATTIMNLANPPSGVYKNIRIPANTNPSFDNNATIMGIMYIQAPNVVTFQNSASFTGVIVADDPPAGSPDSANAIIFNNTSNDAITFNNVDMLPATPEFAAIKKLKGAEILCPGFSMTFNNNFASVGGVMALKSLTVKNNLDSTIYGSLLIYGDAGLNFNNNPDVFISLSGSAPPPGFAGYGLAPLLPDPATYVEH